MPYGKIEEVKLLLRDMRSQKHNLPMYKDDKKQTIYIQSQIRVLPFGLYEYVFPKEDLNLVLSTLSAERNDYHIPEVALKFLRKVLKLDKIPEYEKGKSYLWIRDNVGIIPIGIRYDGEIIGDLEHDKGWKHEAI